MTDSQTAKYISRINKVIDYIENNIDKKLTLEELSDVALFSKYHFHRIFYSITGETLFQYIQRLRVEKASMLLMGDPKRTITQIAYAVGFSSSAAFSRAFKEYFKKTPSQWRKKVSLQSVNSDVASEDSNSSKKNSNLGKIKSNQKKEFIQSPIYTEYRNNLIIWRGKMKNKKPKVEVKNFPTMTVAYVRHVGPYKGNSELFAESFNKLMAWAGPRKYVNFPETKVLIIYHDDPKITEESKLRVSCCISVPEDAKVEGEIGKMEVEGGKYAVARFEEVKSDEYEECWNWVYGQWLPQSGYVPDDKCPFELYPEESKGDDVWTVEICVPVKPA